MRVAAPLFLLAAALFGAPPAAPDEVWKDFLAWFRTVPAPPNAEAILKSYTARLTGDGMGPAEVDARIATLKRLAAERPLDFLGVHFDKLYTAEKKQFREEPSRWIQRMTEGVKPGKALDVGMGQGRNALYLAGKGWQVTGYDISEQGMAIARKAAEAKGLTLETVRASHADFDYGVEKWDLIAMVFAFSPMSDEGFLQRVRRGLKPGGMVCVEQFNAPPGAGAKGPANALFQSFRGERVIAYEDLEDMSDWGMMRARIGRICAVRE